MTENYMVAVSRLKAERDRLAEALGEAQAALVQVTHPYSNAMHGIVDAAVESAREALASLEQKEEG